jgi:porin
MKHSKHYLLMATILVCLTFPFFAEAEENEGDSLWPVPDYTGNLSERPALTGDWGGARTDLADNGITVSVDDITTFQSILDGGKKETEELGGSLDYEVHLDFQKMGLWPGAFVRLFGETQYGDFINTHSGSVLAANTDGLFPLEDEDETTLTSVIFYQFLSEWFAAYFGKIDTLDGDANAFAHGRGKAQFLNQNLVLSPVTFRTVPYAALGGGFLVILPDGESIFTFTAFDPDGQPDTVEFDDAFDEGTVLAGELRLAIHPMDLPGHQLFGASWSSKDYTLLDQDARLLLLDLVETGGVTLQESDDSWSFYYNFDQYIFIEDGDAGQGIGVFGRFGLADEETSPIDQFFSVGLGGTGVIPGRDNDTCGIGYFYIGLSDDLPDLFDVLDDSEGLEIFYNIEVAPWLHVTPDFQIIDPSLETRDTAYVAGIRVKADL